LDRLAILDISSCSVGDEEIMLAARSNFLHTLQVRETELSGDGVRRICRSGLRLAYLALDVPAITDDDLSEIGNFTNLIGLYLVGPKLTDAALVRIGELSKLRELSLHDANITGIGFERCVLEDLRHLVISGTRVNDQTVEFVSRFPGLIYLNIDRTTIGDVGLAKLSTAPKLRRLSAIGSRISDKGVEAVTSGRTKLRVTLRSRSEEDQ
jgi:hypothetical protein